MTVRPHILLAAVAGVALGYGLARAPQWFTAPRTVPAAVAVATAKPVAEIVDELKATKVPERAGRAQDQESEDAFEKLRRDGYM